MVRQNGRIVVEIDGPLNEGFFFRPLSRRLRGRFDCRRLAEPGALLRKFPQAIPGQRIELDAAACTGAIVEPLHLPEFKAVADEVKKAGTLPPAREEFAAVNVDDWAHYIKAQVEAGLAVVVEGQFPPIDTAKVKQTFITTPPPSPMDRLAAALERQTALLAKVLQERGA